MKRVCFFLLLALFAPHASAQYSTGDVAVYTGSVTNNGTNVVKYLQPTNAVSLAEISAGIATFSQAEIYEIVGELLVERLKSTFISTVPEDLGTIGSGGTATLLTTHSVYTVTATGDTWSIALPIGIPEAWYTIRVHFTFSEDRQELTLPNTAYRLELGASTNKIYFPQATSGYGEIYLYVVNPESPEVQLVSGTGDEFSPPTPATVVTVVSGVAATAQEWLDLLQARKADTNALSAVSFSGSYNDLIDKPGGMTVEQIVVGGSTNHLFPSPKVIHDAIQAVSPTLSALNVYASGTAATITTNSALLDFGTTDPSITIGAGTWLLFTGVDLKYEGATVNGATVTTKLRRSNNTAEDVANSSVSVVTDDVTTATYHWLSIPHTVTYQTENSDDVIELHASISEEPAAGAITATRAFIRALRVGDYQESDVTAPQLSSATINSTGTILTLVFDEIVENGEGGNDGFALTASGGSATLTYSSGDGTDTLVYGISRAIAGDETVTLDYTQPGNGIEDAAGNDLASFSGEAVENNATGGTEMLFLVIGEAGGSTAALGQLASRQHLAQIFTNSTGTNFVITRVEASLRYGLETPTTGLIGSYLWAASGTNQMVSLLDTGSTLDSSGIGHTFATNTFNFSGGIVLTNSAQYAIDLSKATTEDGSFVFIASHSEASNHIRSQTAAPGAWSPVSGSVLRLYIYGYQAP